jgi:hypothetical protein
VSLIFETLELSSFSVAADAASIWSIPVKPGMRQQSGPAERLAAQQQEQAALAAAGQVA